MFYNIFIFTSDKVLVLSTDLHPVEGVEAHAHGGDEDEAGGEQRDHLGAVRGLRLLKQVPEGALVRHEVAAAEVLHHLHLAVVHVLLLNLVCVVMFNLCSML